MVSFAGRKQTNYCVWLKMRSWTWDVYWDLCFFILSKKNTLAVNGRKFFRKFLLFGMPFIFLSLVFLNDSMGQHTTHAGRSSDMSFRSSAPIAFLSLPWHIPVLKAGHQTGASSQHLPFFPCCYCFTFRGYVQHGLFQRTWFLII